MSTIDGSIFEGLFLRVLKPEGDFRSQLRSAGFDADKPEPCYPEEVLGRALTVTTAHAFAGDDVATAHRRIGNALIEGYFVTVLGRVSKGLLPVLGVGGTLWRLARLWKVPQPGMRITSEEEGPGQWLVRFHDRVMNADVVAGILETALQRADPAVRVEVVERGFGAGIVRVMTPVPP